MIVRVDSSFPIINVLRIGRFDMSVVIIGGHDRMVCQYKQICKSFNCKAKVFTQMSATLSKQIGNPDLIVQIGRARLNSSH